MVKRRTVRPAGVPNVPGLKRGVPGVKRGKAEDKEKKTEREEHQPAAAFTDAIRDRSTLRQSSAISSESSYTEVVDYRDEYNLPGNSSSSSNSDADAAAKWAAANWAAGQKRDLVGQLPSSSSNEEDAMTKGGGAVD